MTLKGALALLAAALLAGPASAQTRGAAAVEGAARSGVAAVAPVQATAPLQATLPALAAAPLSLSAPPATLSAAPSAAPSALSAPSAPGALKAAPLAAAMEAPEGSTPKAAAAQPAPKARGLAFRMVRMGAALAGRKAPDAGRALFDGSRPAASATVEPGPHAPRGPPARRRGSRVDAVLDAVNPFALLNNKVLGAAHDRVVPESFFTDPADGAVVGVNAVAGDELYRRASNFMTGEGRDAPVVLTHVFSPESLVATLMSVYREHGPIARLVIAAHGAPGYLSIGGRALNAAWARARRDMLTDLPRDLFVPGAVIALISCSTAAGFFWNPGSGRKALKKIFGPMLKQGGVIRASTRYVDPVLGRIPPEYSGWGERFARNAMAPLLLLIETFNWVFGDWTSKVRKIVEIRVPANPSGR